MSQPRAYRMRSEAAYSDLTRAPLRRLRFADAINGATDEANQRKSKADRSRVAGNEQARRGKSPRARGLENLQRGFAEDAVKLRSTFAKDRDKAGVELSGRLIGDRPHRL